MDHPPPFDVLQVALLAGADEADRCYIALAPVIEDEPAPAPGIEILPAHQSPPACGPGAGCDRLHLLAHEPGRKHGGSDTAGNAAIAIGRYGRGTQRQPRRRIEASLVFKQLLQTHGKPRFRDRCEGIAPHVPLLEAPTTTDLVGRSFKCRLPAANMPV